MEEYTNGLEGNEGNNGPIEDCVERKESLSKEDKLGLSSDFRLYKKVTLIAFTVLLLINITVVYLGFELIPSLPISIVIMLILGIGTWNQKNKRDIILLVGEKTVIRGTIHKKSFETTRGADNSISSSTTRYYIHIGKHKLPGESFHRYKEGDRVEIHFFYFYGQDHVILQYKKIN